MNDPAGLACAIGQGTRPTSVRLKLSLALKLSAKFFIQTVPTMALSPLSQLKTFVARQEVKAKAAKPSQSDLPEGQQDFDLGALANWADGINLEGGKSKVVYLHTKFNGQEYLSSHKHSKTGGLWTMLNKKKSAEVGASRVWNTLHSPQMLALVGQHPELKSELRWLVGGFDHGCTQFEIDQNRQATLRKLAGLSSDPTPKQTGVAQTQAQTSAVQPSPDPVPVEVAATVPQPASPMPKAIVTGDDPLSADDLKAFTEQLRRGDIERDTLPNAVQYAEEMNQHSGKAAGEYEHKPGEVKNLMSYIANNTKFKLNPTSNELVPCNVLNGKKHPSRFSALHDLLTQTDFLKHLKNPHDVSYFLGLYEKLARLELEQRAEAEAGQGGGLF